MSSSSVHTALLAAKLVVRCIHPSIGRVVLGDLVAPTGRPAASDRHLAATMGWLATAQDKAGNEGGVSAGFSLARGWLPPYPETTGYIIPTFLDYASYSGIDEYVERARRMAEWELRVQLPEGGVRGGLYTEFAMKPVVFNTGQVILGLCRAAEHFSDQRYLDAARRAGDWLVSAQGPGGEWALEGVTTQTRVHAYDVRTAWSLLELHELTGRSVYRESALRNIDWTLGQQLDNGWFSSNAFFTEGPWRTPLTHTIAYVMEGLLESAKHLPEEDLVTRVQRTADRLLHIYETRRRMAGEYDERWRGNYAFSCVTGDAQIAGVWLQLFNLTRDVRYLNAALRLSDFVMSTQRIASLHPGVQGGVKGSHPIHGKYTRFVYINWGAKFLADTLMLRANALANLEAFGSLSMDVTGEAPT